MPQFNLVQKQDNTYVAPRVTLGHKTKEQWDAKTVQDRKDGITDSIDAQKGVRPNESRAANLQRQTQATGDKFRIFPEDPNSFIDDYLNPGVLIGNMAAGLGAAPNNFAKGNYGQAALGVATPLAAGALGGLGAKGTGQFINNIANPFAGTKLLAKEAIGKLAPNRILSKIDPSLVPVNLLDNKRFNIKMSTLSKWTKEVEPEFKQMYPNVEYDEKDLGLFAKLKKINEAKILNTKPSIWPSVKQFAEEQGFNGNLTPREEVLTEAYTRGYDHRFNKFFAKQSPAFDNEYIPELENIIQKNKLKTPTTLYRNVGNHSATINRNGVEMQIPFSEMEHGDIYIPKRFLSTSLDKEAASAFGAHPLQIHAPEGQSYLLAGNLKANVFPEEQEVLLPSKLQLRFEGQRTPKFSSIKEMEDGLVYPSGHMRKGDTYYEGSTSLGPYENAHLTNMLSAVNRSMHELNPKKFSIVNPYAVTGIGSAGLGLGTLNNK